MYFGYCIINDIFNLFTGRSNKLRKKNDLDILINYIIGTMCVTYIFKNVEINECNLICFKLN
jgi:hypothetical protein